MRRIDDRYDGRIKLNETIGKYSTEWQSKTSRAQCEAHR